MMQRNVARLGAPSRAVWRWLFLLVPSLIGGACGGGGDDGQGLVETAHIAGVAGAFAKPVEPKREASRWTGIQSCEGSIAYQEIETTSETTTIGGFSKSSTRVNVAGLDVGPEPGLACRGLELEGVVTNSDDTSVDFESSRHTSCVSETGRRLLVGWLAGRDFDSKPLGGKYWSLDFKVRIVEDAETLADAGADDRVWIVCSFDLER